MAFCHAQTRRTRVLKGNAGVEKLAQNGLLDVECYSNSLILRSAQDACGPPKEFFNTLE